MSMSYRFCIMFRSLVLILLMASCTGTVPISGRKQFTIITNQSLLSDSYNAYRDVVNSEVLSSDRMEVQRIREIGSRLVDAADRYLAQNGGTHLTDGFSWEFNLIESGTVNAFCMPGGKVAFYTGILPYCENDDGIATVMGHEISHAIAWHAAEQFSKQTLIETVLDLFTSLFSPSATVRTLVYVASDLTKLEYSRRHEAEADHMGLVFMAMAGYNPQEAPEFWERMSSLGGGDIGLLSTHPPSSKRVKNLRKWMPEALQYYKGAGD